MKKYLFIFFFSFSLLCPNIKAQEINVDSLLHLANHASDSSAINARTELFWVYINQKPEVAKAHLDTAINSPFIKNFPKGEAMIYRYYGIYYCNKGSYEKANTYTNKGKHMYTELNDEKNVTRCINDLGVSASEQGDFENALKYYIQTREQYAKFNDKLGEIDALSNIGTVYSILNKVEPALEYLNKALGLATKIDSKEKVLKIYASISDVYGKRNEFKKALKYAYRSLEMAHEINDLYNVAVNHHNIGTYYNQQNNLDSAIYNWKEALYLYQELNNLNNEALISLNIGYAELMLGNHSKAIEYTVYGIDLGKEIGAILPVIQGHSLLFDIYQDKGNYKKALEHNLTYMHLKDSLNGIEVQNRISELQVQFETNEKEQEITLLNEKNKFQEEQAKVKDLEIQAKNRWIYSLSGGGVFILLTVVLFILRQRTFAAKKQEEFMRKQAELKQQVLRAQMNPHFLFNSLNSIQRMYVEGKTDLASDYLSDFSSLLRKILNNTSEEYISVREDIDMLTLYLELEKVRTDNLIDYQIIIDEKIDTVTKKIPPLIIQPFVENAIWHGILPAKRAGQVTITISYESETQLNCSVEDNGIGYFTSQKNKKTTHQSKGINITEQRLGIKDAIFAEELKTGGTLINLKIPTK